MTQYVVRQMELTELKTFYQAIERDFAYGEYAPYNILYDQLETGIQEGLIMTYGNRDMAYAICTVDDNGKYVLISLLAVFPEYRNQGIGTIFMKALKEKYKDKDAILVEVERPELSTTKEEQEFRFKRIGFYEKLGYLLVREFDYTIWDVPMHLMILPLKSVGTNMLGKVPQIITQIYYKLLGSQFIHKLQIYPISK